MSTHRPIAWHKWSEGAARETGDLAPVPATAALVPGLAEQSGPTESTWLVALDIDGTLTGPGRPDVPEQTAHAVTVARTAGHSIALATGRSLVGAMSIAFGLGLTGWVIASNGAVTVRMDMESPGGYRLEDANTLDVEPVIRLGLSLAPDLRIAVEDIGWGYLVNRSFIDGQLNGRQRLVGGPSELWERPAPRIVLSAPGIVGKLLGPLQELGVTAHPNGPDWIDVTPTGLSKASALEAVRKQLGIPSERTVAVGDGVNDIEALQWAARGVAMGHAEQVVRAAADETTGTIDEQGVIAVLESLPFGRLAAEHAAAG